MNRILGYFKYLYLKTLAFLCNNLPFFLEFTRNNNIRGKRLLWKFLKTEKEVIADCKGIKYSLNLEDDIQQQIYLNEYEKYNLNFIIDMLKPGNVFFDIGANVGAYTLPAAKKLKTGNNIYSFEPEPGNFKRLDYNCSINDFSKNINRFRVAISASDGSADLYQSEDIHSGWHSLSEFKDVSSGKIEVTTVKLDSFIEKYKIKKIDLVKIDVEANEFEVLEGAVNSLKANIFKIIFIEFNGPRLAEKNKTFYDLINTFKEFNYFPQKLNMGLVKKLLNKELDQAGICENFLFEPLSND